ncbi:hypothetical protein SAMN06265380_1011156 [Ruegeria faecimaris]|uniref:Uncharacterized protein n=1 Tax=Ruegeria faecimaris TaxID=686389 RepID=A0A521BST1_9RHOB|nr:hypothetical protein SAMN06265380_1011156 [Ruegeria faecimaris]
MNRNSVISHFDPVLVGQGLAPVLPMKRNKKGGVEAADAVYTNAPTQTHFTQAHGLSISCGKRNTHGVRTNG